MKTTRFFFALMLVSLFAMQAQAQGSSQTPHGNAVVSKVELEDNGDGTGTLEIKLTGNLASTVDVISYTLTGDLIKDGSYTSFIDHSKLLVPNPVFVTTILLKENNNTGNGNSDEFVDVDITVMGLAGPGLPRRDRIIARRRRAN